MREDELRSAIDFHQTEGEKLVKQYRAGSPCPNINTLGEALTHLKIAEVLRNSCPVSSAG